MVFVKFHNMNREKNFLMSPLNSNSKIFFTLQQVKTILQSQFKNVQFSFLLFFNLCTDVLSILLKMSVLFFFFFLYAVFNNVQVSSLFFSFRLFSIVPYVFVFVLIIFYIFFHFFFIINCSFNVSFFPNLISTSLCPYRNTITIGSLPSLFNFSHSTIN